MAGGNAYVSPAEARAFFARFLDDDAPRTPSPPVSRTAVALAALTPAPLAEPATVDPMAVAMLALEHRAESPIELDLGHAILRWATTIEPGPDGAIAIVDGWRFLAQHEVSGYRLDFALLSPHGSLAIEADGWEFHGRTQAQASHDRTRDRHLTLFGWTVIRFMGCDIRRDPLACGGEVHKFMRWLARGGGRRAGAMKG